MAYQRRYFPALTITTTAYGDKSVTTDKLADKAVTTPKVADDAITSDQIVDETIKSEDIKDGEVKTSDLAPGAVTTPKIADQAVTVDKLEASIQGIARPLTPGVSTEEIADDAVTKAKLAPNSVGYVEIMPGSVGPTELQADAVEESRVKDGAISTAKIAGGAVTENKIGTDAVTGSKILNRCIGNTEIAIEGCHRENVRDEAINTAKLADVAVSAAKLGTDAVTEPKLDIAALAIRHIESKDTRVMTHFDEFAGVGLSNRWREIGDAGGLVTVDGKDGVQVLSGAVDGNAMRLDWDGHAIGAPLEVQPVLNMWITSRHATLNKLTTLMGLYKDVNNYIAFYAHDVGGATPNWFAHSIYNGAGDQIDTGVPITADIQLLTIDIIAKDSAKFYIDGILKATTTKDHATTDRLEPHLSITTRENVVRWFKMKYLSLLMNRPAYA